MHMKGKDGNLNNKLHFWIRSHINLLILLQICSMTNEIKQRARVRERGRETLNKVNFTFKLYCKNRLFSGLKLQSPKPIRSYERTASYMITE